MRNLRAKMRAAAGCVLVMVSALTAMAERPAVHGTGYVINAELDPATHHIVAKATVSFTAPEGLPAASFGLHPALRVTKISDATGALLHGERGTDGSIRVVPTALFDGQPQQWSFEYDGILSGKEDGPVEGLKLAAIEEPISYLFYPARWFPTTGYLTDRFTMELHIRVPQGMRVFASGATGAPTPVMLTSGKPGDAYSFRWDKPSFPGTVIAGRYTDPVSVGAGNVKVYVTIAHRQAAQAWAETATREYDFFTDSFGMLGSSRLNVVELPDDTLPAAWAPELAAIMGAHVGDKSGARLLANTIAHQWWGSAVSPRSLNDAWIMNGLARYGELMVLENENGKSALHTALADVSAGALAYDTIPLANVSRFWAFTPEFQSMTLEKGAMVFHMLRGVVGDKAFLATLKGALSQYDGKPMSTREFEKVAEAHTDANLTPFFAQWLDGTGAPRFSNKYSVYRLGNNKGFRIIGEIDQDLDLFRMPVELRIETEGKTETKKIEVVGTNTPFVADTFGRPRRVRIDPDDWVLKTTPDLEVRVAILKGQQLVAQNDLPAALAQYQKALEANPLSSLTSYRIGELLFAQRNYQASVNAYRDALRGDGEPKWTEVWSHIQIGKIFDLTGQRDRAVNEYRLAVQTNDNTQGALNEARLRLQKPFKLVESE